MSDAMIGWSSKYRIWDADADPAAFFELGEVTEITPGEESTDRVDVTHYNSPNRRREFVAGLVDAGEASVTINWIPGDETDLFIRAMRDSGAKAQHQIEFPNGVTVTFDGIVLSYSKSIPIDDRMQATFTVAVSGAETWGTAA
jgi:hypothetical protein